MSRAQPQHSPARPGPHPLASPIPQMDGPLHRQVPVLLLSLCAFHFVTTLWCTRFFFHTVNKILQDAFPDPSEEEWGACPMCSILPCTVQCCSYHTVYTILTSTLSLPHSRLPMTLSQLCEMGIHVSWFTTLPLVPSIMLIIMC